MKVSNMFNIHRMRIKRQANSMTGFQAINSQRDISGELHREERKN